MSRIKIKIDSLNYIYKTQILQLLESTPADIVENESYDIVITDGNNPDIYITDNPIAPIFTISVNQPISMPRNYQNRFYKIKQFEAKQFISDVNNWINICEVVSDLLEYMNQQDEKLEKLQEKDEYHTVYTKSARKWQFEAQKPNVHSFDCKIFYEPHLYLSGDFCCVNDDRNISYFIIGDVSDHGIHAAMVGTAYKSMIETYLSICPESSIQELITYIQNHDDIFYHKNNTLNLPYSVHATVIRIDKIKNQCEIVSIGNGDVPPIFITNGKAKKIDLETNKDINLFPFGENAPFINDSQIITMPFNINDMMVLYTDGITEAFCTEKEDAAYFYSSDRLTMAINRKLMEDEFCTVKDIECQILDDLNNYMQSKYGDSQRKSHDDTTIMVFQRKE